MKTIPLVLGALVKDNNVLLIERIKYPFKGMWALPGGKIEFGEDLKQAIAREMLEETGIRITSSELKAVINETLEDENKNQLDHFLMFFYKLESDNLEFQEKDEGRLRLFDLNGIDNHGKIIGSDLQMVKRLLHNQKPSIYKSVIMQKKNKYELLHFKEEV